MVSDADNDVNENLSQDDDDDNNDTMSYLHNS